MYKVSVIIPVYNVEQYLEQCLDSVCHQTYEDMEIILIDDGSADKSGGICDAYAQRDFRIQVIHQENQGLSSARNRGIEQSTGEWLLFVDSDDWCQPDYVKDLAGHAQEDVDIVMTGVFKQLRDGTMKHCSSLDRDCKITDKEMIRFIQANVPVAPSFMDYNFKNPWEIKMGSFIGGPWNKLYRREFIAKNHIRFDVNARAYEDLIFNLNCFEYASCLSNYNKGGYNYRLVSTSITKKFDQERLKKELYFFDVMQAYIDKGENEYLSLAAYSHIAFSLFVNLNRYFFNQKNRNARGYTELKNILSQPYYDKAFQNLDIRRINKKYWVPFILAKKKQTLLLMRLVSLKNAFFPK